MGYDYGQISIVNFASMNIISNISSNDLEEFKKDFGMELILKGASNWELFIAFEYICDHKLLFEFRNHLRDWLSNNIPQCAFSTITEGISLHVGEMLSDSQIEAFEEEFDVKCMGYFLECISDDIEYKFQ